MPHFILECSESLEKRINVDQILQLVHDTAESSGLFDKGNIKVRMRSFNQFIAGTGNEDFLHVFAYIMQGRTQEQKKTLSDNVVRALKHSLPQISVLSMNVMEFEKASYSNQHII